MIITISGSAGSGKTRIGKELAKKLNYKNYSVGDIQGKLAIERGLTITEMMTLEKNNPEIHKQVDKKTEELGKTKDNLVVDGWIAYHFIPHSYKIFLDVDEIVGASRIFKGGSRPDEPKRKSLGSTIIELKQRLEETKAGFEKAHKIDFLDPNNYDYVLDTTNLTIKQILEKIIKNLPKPKKQKFYFCHPRESRFKFRALQSGFEKRTGITLFNPFFDKENEDVERNHLGKEKYKELADYKKLVEQDIQSVADPEVEGLIVFIDTTDSWGTPMEMVYAKKILGKKVYSVITNGDHHHPWLKYHSDEIFTSSEDLEKFLIEKAKKDSEKENN